MNASSPGSVLLIGPSWVGDAVMATPAIRLIRETWPHARLDMLTRQPVDAVLAGLESLDGVRTDRLRTIRDRVALARSLKAEGYEAALLFSNAFGSALLAAMAGIPRRVGYDRDGRGCLLTHRLRAPIRGASGLQRRWAVVPAVDYYAAAAAALVGVEPPSGRGVLELALTEEDRSEGDRLASQAGVADAEPIAVLNPGGNNPAKRWPADRFARLADHLAAEHGLTVLVNGSPAERALTEEIVSGTCARSLASLGGSIPGLKALVARSRLVVTNDTGPRHIAAALGTPVVTLFGPTDHRWTTITTRPMPDGGGSETILLADPTLPEHELANDHPQRCRIENIRYEDVAEACDALLERRRD